MTIVLVLFLAQLSPLLLWRSSGNPTLQNRPRRFALPVARTGSESVIPASALTAAAKHRKPIVQRRRRELQWDRRARHREDLRV